MLVANPLASYFMGLRVTGRDRLVSGAQVLASNHVSNIDPVIVGLAAMRELHFLAKEELFRASRLFGWLIRKYNALPVRRGSADAAAIKCWSRVLRSGQTLVLFPEGTRSKTGEIAQFKPGVGMLAIRNRVPVVPTLIQGLDKSWVSHAVDRDFVQRGCRRRPDRNRGIRVSFGEPVHPRGFDRTREGYAAMTRVVEERVRGLREEKFKVRGQSAEGKAAEDAEKTEA